MSRFSIYSSDGQTIRHSGKPKYIGTYLKVPYVEFGEIASPVKIDWAVGDYLDYSRTGLRYKLYSLPQPKKQSRSNEAGASFVYSNVQLFDATKELEIALFNDLVLDVEQNVHFSTRDNITTYENVYGIARRIQASVDAFFPNRWVIQVMTLDPVADADLLETISEAKEFQLSNGTCLGALNQIYNTWEGIGWIHTYNATTGKDVITIGRPNKRDALNTTSPFVYGLGNGLTAIKKSFTNTSEFATRLYVYGSDRNLPNRYYNGLAICNADSVDIANLMLPLRRWGTATDPVTGQTRPDARLAYLEDAEAISKYGLIPKKVYFDGSQNEAIFPSVKNLTAGRLRTAKAEQHDTNYVPNTTMYPDAERLDQVKDAVNPIDGGGGDEDTYIFSETVNVPFCDGSGTLYNASGSPATTDPIEVQVCNYSPSRSGTRMKVEPQYRLYINVVAVDNITVKQKVRMTVRLADGSTEVQTEETELSPVRLSANSDTYYVDLAEDYNICAGTIENVKIILSVNRARTVATDMTVTIRSATENTQPIFFGFKEKYDDTFQMILKQIGFNLSDQMALANGGLCTISMKDGMCGGRNFTVKRCTYRATTDDWLLTVKRVQDQSTNMLYPNANFPVSPGDTFVILDIVMPELYVLIAQETLLEAGLDLLSQVCVGHSYYEPEINAKQIVGSGVVLKEGMYMQIQDSDVIDTTTDYILIDTLQISEDESNIPTYKVTLREKKRVGYAEVTATALQQLSTQIKAGGGGARFNLIRSNDTTPEADDNTYSALREQLEFLSKKYDDIAQGLITFLQGAKFGNFADGITGFGGKIDGGGNGELNSLVLRHFLEVPELRYNRIEIQIGNKWNAPGGGIIESVEVDYDANGNPLNTGIITLHLENGEIGLVELDDICMGIYHDNISAGNNSAIDTDDSIGNFHFAGFYTAYFRVTEILTQDNRKFRYALRPVSTNWPETFHPCEAMHFVGYGNFDSINHANRQTARYSTRTYERFLKDVHNWEFTADNIGAQFGDLSNLSVFGLDMSGYSAYLNNIYMSGVIEQFELLPYRMEIDTEGQDTLAYGESLTAVCSVWKGWDDVTSQVVQWHIERDSGDALADAAWNLSSKAINFRGTIVIEHNQNYSDLGTIGVSTLFTMTAVLSDGDSAEYTLTI
ncbi:MAG: hypothetical protein IJK99_09230 [Bacteroidales bacterium]|nr:hypothetical protein [Bacteroidales bacterium]